MPKCVDCEYCDAANLICRTNNKKYNLTEADLWTESKCEFFKGKENSVKINEENN